MIFEMLEALPAIGTLLVFYVAAVVDRKARQGR
jgi:hypothetical protein